MKKIICITSFCATILAAPAFAIGEEGGPGGGGAGLGVSTIRQDAAANSSSNGIIIPLVLLAIVGAVIAAD